MQIGLVTHADIASKDLRFPWREFCNVSKICIQRMVLGPFAKERITGLCSLWAPPYYVRMLRM